MCKNSLYFTFTSCVQKKDKYVFSNGPEFFFCFWFGILFCCTAFKVHLKKNYVSVVNTYKFSQNYFHFFETFKYGFFFQKGAPWCPGTQTSHSLSVSLLFPSKEKSNHFTHRITQFKMPPKICI